MRKFLTIALVLVMAMGIAAPAMAYTTNTAQSGSSLYTLDIYLVEYSGSDALSTMISKPSTDRGYATNEVVAAIGAITVPGHADVVGDGYEQLRFDAYHVNLNVTDNNPVGNVNRNRFNLVNTMPTSANWQSGEWYLDDDSMTHVLGSSTNSNIFPVVSSSKTYRFLVFGKVTGDDATMTFVLGKSATFIPAVASSTFLATIGGVSYSGSAYLPLGDNYVVFKSATTNEYLVFSTPLGTYTGGAVNAQDLAFRIGVNSKGKTERLYMYSSGTGGYEYRVLVEPSTKELIFVYSTGGKAFPSNISAGDQVRYGSSSYTSLRFFYDTEFENALGLSAYYEGNIMRDKDWGKIAGAGDISETVSIQPWTPYVSIPDVVVVNPPKTGQTATMLGFVLIALAGAAAIAIRKVRA